MNSQSIWGDVIDELVAGCGVRRNLNETDEELRLRAFPLLTKQGEFRLAVHILFGTTDWTDQMDQIAKFLDCDPTPVELQIFCELFGEEALAIPVRRH